MRLVGRTVRPHVARTALASHMTDTATNCFQRCQCHEAEDFADELPALIIQVCNALRSSLAAAAARCTLPPPHAAAAVLCQKLTVHDGGSGCWWLGSAMSIQHTRCLEICYRL